MSEKTIEYIIRIGLDGRWITGEITIPHYLNTDDVDAISKLAMEDAYSKGDLEVILVV